MKKANTALWVSAAICGVLMTGCGTNSMADRAEQTNRATTAKTDQAVVSESDSDRDHALYEEDDVHRKTDRNEPNLIDRAESALDSVESAVTDAMTDAKKKMDDMKEDE